MSNKLHYNLNQYCLDQDSWLEVENHIKNIVILTTVNYLKVFDWLKNIT